MRMLHRRGQAPAHWLVRQARPEGLVPAGSRPGSPLRVGPGAHVGIPRRQPGTVPAISHAPFPVVDDAADAADTGDASDPRLASEMSEELTVLFFGTIRPYKGLEHLVQVRPRQERVRAAVEAACGRGDLGRMVPSPRVDREQQVPRRYRVGQPVRDRRGSCRFLQACRRRGVAVPPFVGERTAGNCRGVRAACRRDGGRRAGEAVADYSGAVQVQPGDPYDLTGDYSPRPTCAAARMLSRSPGTTWPVLYGYLHLRHAANAVVAASAVRLPQPQPGQAQAHARSRQVQTPAPTGAGADGCLPEPRRPRCCDRRLRL